MIDEILVIDSTVRIFHSRGMFFAGWQPMDRPSLPIEQADLVLLDTISDGGGYGKIIETYREKLRTHALQVCSPLQVTNRLNELIQAQIVRTVRGAAQPVRDTSVSLKGMEFDNGPGRDKSTANRSLRVSRNFMLRPVQGGFQTWSPVLRTDHTLSLELVLILTSFSAGRNVSHVLAERRVAADTSKTSRAIKWLHDTGFLVSVRDLVSYQHFQSSIKGKAIGEQALREPSNLNGRIPIYFVPHMPNHYPLALGMMFSFIMHHNGGKLLERYMPVPIVYAKTPADLLTGAYRNYGRGIWLFSNYMWSLSSNLKVSAAVKDHDRRNVTIHGGPSTPSFAAACTKFLNEYKTVDIAVHGEGEFTVVQLLESLDRENTDKLQEVRGITFRKVAMGEDGVEREEIIRTEPRARIRNLDMLPSPYLSGVFDSYGGSIDAAIVESNRGCPFGCTFCDWGSATKQQIRKFDLQRVKKEIEWIGRNQIRVIWIADANFGIYERDIEITEFICSTKNEYGYPKEVVVNYTKNATKRLAKIVELFAANDVCSQGVISIQTRDKATLEVINRKNIKTDKYDELADIFRLEGLPLSTDLMIGLPGMTIESFKEDLQYFFDKDITVKAYPTELLPNSPMADPEYIEKYEIEVDENNFLTSTFSYSRDDLHEMNVIYYLFTISDSFSVLRYVLRYLRWDHGINALDFLHKLYGETRNDPYRYPLITYMAKVFQHYMNVPGGWRQFYNEVAGFTKATYGIERDSAFNAVLYFNEAVMPDDALSYPLKVQLEHDVSRYFSEHNLNPAQNGKPLDTYGPTHLMIDDKYFFGHINYNNKQYDSHQIFWELRSPVARHQSVPNFS